MAVRQGKKPGGNNKWSGPTTGTSKFEIATVSGDHWDGPGTLPFRFILATLDLTFSLVFDTVMLPWDVTMAWADSHSLQKTQPRAKIVEGEKTAATGAGGGV